jgi:hypothetical protein
VRWFPATVTRGRAGFWASCSTLCLPVVVAVGLAGGLILNGCSGSDSTSVDDPVEAEPHELEGAWTTTGTDDRYGEASVRMQMKADGDLVVTIDLAVGGTLRFAGEWETQEKMLLLTGTYFEPDGQASATWSVEGDSVMVLRAADGDQQRWRRAG